MSDRDRPSRPTPLVTPAEGFLRPGLIYIDDSPTALQAMRRTLYPYGLLLETFPSLAEYRKRPAGPLRGFLLDGELEHGVTGATIANVLRSEHPTIPVAFLTAETVAERRAALRAYGPVFAKDRETDRAVEWLLALSGIQSISWLKRSGNGE